MLISDSLRTQFIHLCEKHSCTEDEAIGELIRQSVVQDYIFKVKEVKA